MSKQVLCLPEWNYELIDTLWNVNMVRQPILESRECELIDTLWNVNLSPVADDAP